MRLSKENGRDLSIAWYDRSQPQLHIRIAWVLAKLSGLVSTAEWYMAIIISAGGVWASVFLQTLPEPVQIDWETMACVFQGLQQSSLGALMGQTEVAQFCPLSYKQETHYK